ncbi:MAG: hypothetical protein HW397_139, partial [Dehalococcoidia bacterium]|nr:hypothetical protein [Dehalococcoidia bacterium]
LAIRDDAIHVEDHGLYGQGRAPTNGDG